jgi:hypothetical protein
MERTAVDEFKYRAGGLSLQGLMSSLFLDVMYLTFRLFARGLVCNLECFIHCDNYIIPPCHSLSFQQRPAVSMLFV